MAWFRQVKGHYLSQCWPRALLPYRVIRPQWINIQSSYRKARTGPTHFVAVLGIVGFAHILQGSFTGAMCETNAKNMFRSAWADKDNISTAVEIPKLSHEYHKRHRLNGSPRAKPSIGMRKRILSLQISFRSVSSPPEGAETVLSARKAPEKNPHY